MTFDQVMTTEHEHLVHRVTILRKLQQRFVISEGNQLESVVLSETDWYRQVAPMLKQTK